MNVYIQLMLLIFMFSSIAIALAMIIGHYFGSTGFIPAPNTNCQNLSHSHHSYPKWEGYNPNWSYKPDKRVVLCGA